MLLTAENTAIVLDSTADFPDARERHANWRVVPQYVVLGDESFRDYVDLTPAEFYRRLRASPDDPPRTAQATPTDFEVVFTELAATYDRSVALVLPPTLSGAFGNAEQAAESIGEGRVLVLNSGTISAGTTLLADAVQRRLEHGTDEAELHALADRFRHEVGFLLSLDTMEYLVRGGRVGRARGLVGLLLGLKPILTLEDGIIVPVRRVLGRRRSLEELRRLLVERTRDGPRLHLAISHADAEADAQLLVAAVGAARPQASLDRICMLGPALGAHTGPGAVALFWFEDE